MSKFKFVPQNFVYRTMVGFWGNLVENFDGDAFDSNFFDIAHYNFEHDAAVELIEAAYEPSELEQMKKCRARNTRLDLGDSQRDIFLSLWANEEGRGKCKVILKTIKEYLLKNCSPTDNDTTERRFKELQKLLKLSNLELELAKIAYVVQYTDFCWPRRIEDRLKPLFYAMALDVAYEEVVAALKPEGKLRKFGVLDDDWDFNRGNFGAFLDGSDDDGVTRRFYDRVSLEKTLPWSYYGPIADKEGKLLKRILRNAKGKCNVLLYGAPGTGKTSMAHTLAKELGFEAFEVQHGRDDGAETKLSSRIIGIRIASSREGERGRMLIVDEADAILRWEKGVVNSLLDEMKLPTIWISNMPAMMMDESVRRRFDYSIHFEPMSDWQRYQVWKNIVNEHELKDLIGDFQLKVYSSKYRTSAGGISQVLENVKRLNPKREKVDELVDAFMRPHCKLMGLETKKSLDCARDYSLGGLNVKGKIEPKKIVKAIKNFYDAAFNLDAIDKPRMNVLMFGPPGTGKTEFVKYLGKKLSRKVTVVKGSDLLDKYVGETEQKIAEAFSRAEADGSILFFDEIDGIVQDRAGASNSWEVSQVNELLQQMENFSGVMIAATNFNANLDSAIMRRFTFKLEFDYLDDEGKRLFFERMFMTKLTPSELARLNRMSVLTPGDFRTVRQELFYLDEDVTNSDRLEALEAECARKKDGKRLNRIGFSKPVNLLAC